MFSEIAVGDTATVSYRSERSGNVVSRKGKVLQVPNGDKNGFFIRSGDEQLTCIMGERVFSVSVNRDNGAGSVRRKTMLGALESVDT